MSDKAKITAVDEPKAEADRTDQPARNKQDAQQDQPAKDDTSEKPHDIVLLHGRTEDGQGVRALRSRPGRLDLAELRPLQEGKPVNSEIVRLHPHKKTPNLCDVEVQYSPEESKSSPGPAQVATARYRRNWESIFGKKRSGRSGRSGQSKKKELPN